MKTHKHNFKISKSEQRYFKKMMRDQDAQSKLMHKVCWEFYKKFTVKNELNEWKYFGYDLMQRVERWAKKYPQDVFICRVDDSFHANSDIVFILHRTRRKLWGTTAFVLTQLDGQIPCEFFLYPRAMRDICDVFKKIGRIPSLYPV